MEWAVNFVEDIYRSLKHRDDTSIDRLNRLYTVAILGMFVALISNQQFIVGKRIICWTPQEFSGAHVTYTEDICWIGQQNYFISPNQTTLDHPMTPRMDPFVLHPWLLLILLSMIISFLLPYQLIWRGLSSKFGLDVKRLMTICQREELIRAIDFSLAKRYSRSRVGSFYLMIIYLITKTGYLMVTISQLNLVNKILFGSFFRIDFEHIQRILSVKYNLWSSPHLPIETMCDFMIRMLGQNNNWYTVQCILPFNLFTKRVFAVLILWFFVLLFLNFIDLFYIWLWKRVFSSVHRYNFIFHYLDFYLTHLHQDKPNEIDREYVANRLLRHEFVRSYLGLDGFLFLQLHAGNSSEINISRLIIQLFARFLQVREKPTQEALLEKDRTII